MLPNSKTWCHKLCCIYPFSPLNLFLSYLKTVLDFWNSIFFSIIHDENVMINKIIIWSVNILISLWYIYDNSNLKIGYSLSYSKKTKLMLQQLFSFWHCDETWFEFSCCIKSDKRFGNITLYRKLVLKYHFISFCQ